jgi:hypothetical protein
MKIRRYRTPVWPGGDFPDLTLRISQYDPNIPTRQLRSRRATGWTILICRPSERRDKIPHEEVYSDPFEPAARAELLAVLDEDVLTLPPLP